jgi:hypothetical protein
MRGDRRQPAVLVTEQETGVRAYLALADAELVRTAGAHFLANHTQPIELILGSIAMRLVDGRELLGLLARADGPAPVILLSQGRWRKLRGEDPRLEPDPSLTLPFDPQMALAYLERLRQLSGALPIGSRPGWSACPVDRPRRDAAS